MSEPYNKSDKFKCLSCLFSEGRSHSMCKASFILSWKTVGAKSKMEKQASRTEIPAGLRILQMFVNMGVTIWK